MATELFQRKVQERRSDARANLREEMTTKMSRAHVLENKTRQCFDWWRLSSIYGSTATVDVFLEFRPWFNVQEHVPKCQEVSGAMDCENSLTCIDWSHRRDELNR